MRELPSIVHTFVCRLTPVFATYTYAVTNVVCTKYDYVSSFRTHVPSFACPVAPSVIMRVRFVCKTDLVQYRASGASLYIND